MREGDQRRLVLLGGSDQSTHIVYRALSAEFSTVELILERPVSRLQVLLRRARRLGLLRAFGQLLFLTTAVPVLRLLSSKRIKEIKRDAGLDDRPVTAEVIQVASVNCDEARRALKELKPAVTVVNGTRIIGVETLSAVAAPFLNMHAGITPAYRGVHGGYWALREGRKDLVGTTIHLIDEGIDTGGIVEQAFFHPTVADSFASYPYLHLAAGIPALIKAVHQALDGTLQVKDPPTDIPPSRLHYHPTLWDYLSGRFRKRVK